MFKWIFWLFKGKPFIEYPGFNCGCCGKWINESFKVPTYKSFEYWDTIGICKNCIKETKEK